MSDLQQRQNDLQEEAKQVLDDLDLVKFLSKYGIVDVGGSFKTGLMVWRDIDIGVIKNPLSEEAYWKTVKFLFGIKDYYHSLYIQDFRNSVNPNSPKGLYIGTKLNFNGKIWKIDVWFTKEKNDKDFEKWLIAKLNSENKEIIMQIKNQVYQNPKYRKEFTSVDIYKAVIEKGIEDLDGFKKYLLSLGKNLD